MRITQQNTAAIVVDIQERLVPVIDDGANIVKRSATLIEGLRALGVPIVVARQYPKGLGDTVPEIKEALGHHTPLDKVIFSAVGEAEIAAKLATLGVKNVLVFGVEAHVCVLGTVIDLAADGYQPVLVCDCTGSRTPYNREIGIQRALQEGALAATMESVLFELCAGSQNPQFKTISALVK